MFTNAVRFGGEVNPDFGETLGLVGESGCGKTTTAKLILAAEEPTAGAIEFEGRDIAKLDTKQRMDYRRKVQVVFQDPYSSLSPRMRVGEIVGEPLEAHQRLSRRELQSRVQELLALVGLRPEAARLFPHEFSGGQRQRLAIARALSTNARLIVLDEPVSALDVSITAHIIRLLEEIQLRLAVSYLFIAHDLAAVSHMSHRTAVMYLGKLVEVADSLELCAKPLHPYTKALFATTGGRKSSSPVKSPALSIRRLDVAFIHAALSSCLVAPSRSPNWSSWPRATMLPATFIEARTSA